jgi:hypothetical protein
MSETPRRTPPAEPIEAEVVSSSPTPAGSTDPVIEAEIVPDRRAVPAAPAPSPDYDDHGVPSFDYVRDKIEGRYATSIGSTELAAETPEGRTVDDQFAERERAAKAKLEEIRRSLRG